MIIYQIDSFEFIKKNFNAKYIYIRLSSQKKISVIKLMKYQEIYFYQQQIIIMMIVNCQWFYTLILTLSFYFICECIQYPLFFDEKSKKDYHHQLYSHYLSNGIILPFFLLFSNTHHHLTQLYQFQMFNNLFIIKNRWCVPPSWVYLKKTKKPFN